MPYNRCEFYIGEHCIKPQNLVSFPHFGPFPEAGSLTLRISSTCRTKPWTCTTPILHRTRARSAAGHVGDVVTSARSRRSHIEIHAGRGRWGIGAYVTACVLEGEDVLRVGLAPLVQ